MQPGSSSCKLADGQGHQQARGILGLLVAMYPAGTQRDFIPLGVSRCCRTPNIPLCRQCSTAVLRVCDVCGIDDFRRCVYMLSCMGCPAHR